MKSNVASTTCEIRRRHLVHCHAHIGQPQRRTWSPMHRTKNNRDNVTDQLTVSSALHHRNTMMTKYCIMETIAYKFRNAIEMAGQIELVFGTKALSTYPILCYKEIQVSIYIWNFF